MRKKTNNPLLLLVLLLIIVTSVFTGCASPSEPLPYPPPTSEPPPKGEQSPINFDPTLSDMDKAKAIEITLNTPWVSEWLEGESEYSIRVSGWYAIRWENGKWVQSSYYSEENLRDGVSTATLESDVFYPRVSIVAGGSRTAVAVDLETEEVVWSNGISPLRKGPPPPPPKEPETNWGLVGGLIAAVVVIIGMIVYMVIRRQRGRLN